MYNYAFIKKNLDEITLDYFKMVANICMTSNISNIAPLGFSSDSFLLFGRFIDVSESKDGKWHRESMVQLRNYCGELQLLVTDKKGKFLVHSSVNGLSANEIIEELYRQFLLVKPYIKKTIKETFKNWDISDNVEFSEGFKILEEYYLRKETKNEN